MSKYDDDFYAWTQNQAALLRAGAWSALDIEHLAEEIEDLGKRDRRAAESYLEVIELHLLKWTYQPERRSASWQKSLLQARHRLGKLLQENPSFGYALAPWISAAYDHVRRLAALETGLPEKTFPLGCPWEVRQVLNKDFLPEAPEARP